MVFNVTLPTFLVPKKGKEMMVIPDQPAAADSCFDLLGSRHLGVIITWADSHKMKSLMDPDLEPHFTYCKLDSFSNSGSKD